ncbi:hypothetical protein VTK26DRAFT_2342 [Humicola hyalothermophila]
MRASVLCLALGAASLATCAPVPVIRSKTLSLKSLFGAARHDISSLPGFITPDHQLEQDGLPPFPEQDTPIPGSFVPQPDGTQLYPTYPPDAARQKGLGINGNDTLAVYMVLVFAVAVVMMETWKGIRSRLIPFLLLSPRVIRFHEANHEHHPLFSVEVRSEDQDCAMDEKQRDKPLL